MHLRKMRTLHQHGQRNHAYVTHSCMHAVHDRMYAAVNMYRPIRRGDPPQPWQFAQAYGVRRTWGDMFGIRNVDVPLPPLEWRTVPEDIPLPPLEWTQGPMPMARVAWVEPLWLAPDPGAVPRTRLRPAWWIPSPWLVPVTELALPW